MSTNFKSSQAYNFASLLIQCSPDATKSSITNFLDYLVPEQAGNETFN